MWAGVSPFSPGADVGGVSPCSPGADVGRRWDGPIVSAMTSSTESSVRQRFRNTPPITCEYPQYPLLCRGLVTDTGLGTTSQYDISGLADLGVRIPGLAVFVSFGYAFSSYLCGVLGDQRFRRNVAVVLRARLQQRNKRTNAHTYKQTNKQTVNPPPPMPAAARAGDPNVPHPTRPEAKPAHNTTQT